jgi:hypothetical protein
MSPNSGNLIVCVCVCVESPCRPFLCLVQRANVGICGSNAFVSVEERPVVRFAAVESIAPDMSHEQDAEDVARCHLAPTQAARSISRCYLIE